MYIGFLGLGLAAPFVLTLGYVWVDIFRPQSVAWNGLGESPSLIIAAAAVAFYILFDRRSPPRLGLPAVLTVLLLIWVTLTTTWAEVPAAAWAKWDWAVKSLIFSLFIPFAIRSRNQVEAFLQIYVFALAATFIPFGIKALISGGGYGMALGLQTATGNLANGENLATYCLAGIPLLLYLRKHTHIIPRNRVTQAGYIGLIVLAFVASVGTYERTSIVALFVLTLAYWIRARRKILFGALCAVAVVVGMAVSSEAWLTRMSTMRNYQADGSASGRVAAWLWTLDYAMSHPFGGGFQAFLIDEVEYEVQDPVIPGKTQVVVRKGIAFHNSYLEVLGEHGWIGLALFLGLAISSFRSLSRVKRFMARRADSAWCTDLCHALQVALLVFGSGGAFIELAFQPFAYYVFALSVSLREYARRLENESIQPMSVHAGYLVPSRL